MASHECHGCSSRHRLNSLFHNLFELTSKKISNYRITGPNQPTIYTNPPPHRVPWVALSVDGTAITVLMLFHLGAQTTGTITIKVTTNLHHVHDWQNACFKGNNVYKPIFRIAFLIIKNTSGPSLKMLLTRTKFFCMYLKRVMLCATNFPIITE